MIIRQSHGRSGSHTVSPAEKCFLPGGAGFWGFLAQGSRTNKCQHLCQMGTGWNFCAPHQSTKSLGDLKERFLRHKQSLRPYRIFIRSAKFYGWFPSNVSTNVLTSVKVNSCERHE